MYRTLFEGACLGMIAWLLLILLPGLARIPEDRGIASGCSGLTGSPPPSTPEGADDQTFGSHRFALGAVTLVWGCAQITLSGEASTRRISWFLELAVPVLGSERLPRCAAPGDPNARHSGFCPSELDSSGSGALLVWILWPRPDGKLEERRVRRVLKGVDTAERRRPASGIGAGNINALRWIYT